MPYNKKRLCELFMLVYKNTREGFEDIDKHRRIKILGGSGTKIQIDNERGTFTGEIPEDAPKTLSIIDDGVDAIDMFIDEIMKEDEIKEHVSRRGIEKKIEEALQHNFKQLNDVDMELFVKTYILKSIRSSIQEWTVFVPVLNLHIEGELSLGDVTFVSRDKVDEEVKEFMSKGEYLFHGETEEEMQNNKNALMGQVQQTINYCQAFAKVICKSHSSNIETVAYTKTYVAINSIRAFTHVLYTRTNRTLWGLPQEIVFGLSGIISLDYSEKHSFNINNRINGALIPFVLNIAYIKKLQDICCLEKIKEILNKSNKERTSLESVIINSLQSMGKAIVAPTTDMRFLGYVVALERLLIKDGEETTTERFTDRLALALAENAADRLAIVKTAKELYDKRSKMVHAASFYDVFEEDEIIAEKWAINIIIQALKKSSEGYKHDKFCKEINDKKYGEN